MTEIKICGITNVDDAMCAALCGADALGFIFHRKSARYVEPDEAAAIIDCLPENVARVGVFVNHQIPEIREIVSSCRLDIIQLHGDEPPEYCRHLPSAMVVKAFNPERTEDLMNMLNYNVKAFLVDSREKDLYGGTGKTANWELAAQAAANFPLVLAGGLDEHNIEEAIDRVAPVAVDINSGVETLPGKKDHEKVRKIINLIRGRKPSAPARAGIFTVKR